MVLDGQQHRLNRRQSQQGIGENGDQNMQLQRPLTGIGDDALGGKQQAENQRQGAEGQHDDAEVFGRPDHRRRQQDRADQPAGEGQRVEKAEIQAGGLEHGLGQNRRM